MELLATPLGALLFAAASALVGWMGRGLSFVVVRWWTGAPKKEKAEYLNCVADLASKLRANGMTIEEIHELEAIVRNPGKGRNASDTTVIAEKTESSAEPEIFESNVAMKARAGAALGVAEAKLEQALMDLRLLIGEDEWTTLETAQGRWQEYRSALEDCALQRYHGGTHATLALALTGLAETERRTSEIEAEIAERSSI